MHFNVLPKDVILYIFSVISFKLLRRNVSLVCKKWHRISEDTTIVKLSSTKEFELIRLCQHLTYLQLKNVVEKIIWLRSADIKLLDLAKTAISWEYVNENHTRKSQWSNLRILNIVKLVTMEFKVTTAFANLVELNVCESKFNNTHLDISKMCNTLRILNVSGCSITDVGIEKASLESLIFINISNWKFLTERSIHRIIENWETSSLCVKGLNLSVVQIEELYGDDICKRELYRCVVFGLNKNASACIVVKPSSKRGLTSQESILFWLWSYDYVDMFLLWGVGYVRARICSAFCA